MWLRAVNFLLLCTVHEKELAKIAYTCLFKQMLVYMHSLEYQVLRNIPLESLYVKPVCACCIPK